MFQEGHKHSPKWYGRMVGNKINLGKKHTSETIRKRVNSRKGYRHSEETLRKIGLGNKGKRVSKESRQKMSKAKKGKPSPNKGKKASLETRKKQSKAKKGKIPWNIGLTKKTDERVRKYGEKGSITNKGRIPWNYQGGISFEPYGIEFNEDLKEVIRNRDRRKCQLCEKTELENEEKLSVHHIDYDKKNNDPDNLISLCRSCHSKTQINRENWKQYFKSL
ncbi:MAG TPA: hypothetical protein ENI13_02060 [candidate division CPR3 bacterium]|uniref:HNH nuclease domain-containing protein n=1 Tax=candidate division CPR3 bacterium TaxID=2268181 RepID=A0A7C1NSS0_UNCC3|nr:hypothetical protein [candidate division CPR3 bacterium]